MSQIQRTKTLLPVVIRKAIDARRQAAGLTWEELAQLVQASGAKVSAERLRLSLGPAAKSPPLAWGTLLIVLELLALELIVIESE